MPRLFFHVQKISLDMRLHVQQKYLSHKKLKRIDKVVQVSGATLRLHGKGITMIVLVLTCHDWCEVCDHLVSLPHTHTHTVRAPCYQWSVWEARPTVRRFCQEDHIGRVLSAETSPLYNPALVGERKRKEGRGVHCLMCISVWFWKEGTRFQLFVDGS